MNLTPIPAVAAIALSLSALPAAAVTFVYAGSVASTSTSNPSAVFPAVGEAATVTLSIDGAAGDPLPMDFGTQTVLSASLSVPGFLSAGFSDFLESVSFDADGVFVGTPEGMPTFVTQTFPGTFTTYSVFGLTFGSPAAAAPTTVGELIAALETPGATGLYGFSGSGPQGDSVRVEVAFADVAPPVIPLPAGLPVLLSALAGLGALRLARRRA